MDCGLLYSGGRDSSLAALLLEDVCDVTLVTATAGVTDDWQYAREAAERLGFPFERLDLDRAVLEDAVDRIVADGRPRAGIQAVHEAAMEALAITDVEAVADGTRRDDRTPTVGPDRARSLEDRHGVAHLAPLAGVGHGAVAGMADAVLELEAGPSETIDRGDYEAELRALIDGRPDAPPVAELFPPHEQSRVLGRR